MEEKIMRIKTLEERESQFSKLNEERERVFSGIQRAMYHTAVMLLIEPLSGRIVDANPAACAFYGYDREKILNMCIQDINMLPKEEVKKRRLLALQEKQRYFVFPHRLKNGEIRLVDVYSCPITHNREKLLFSIIFDVTDRVKYKIELYRENELLSPPPSFHRRRSGHHR